MLAYISQNVTVAGAEKLVHSNKIKRLAWSVLLSIVTGFCLFHLHNRLDYYFLKPITVSMHTEYQKDGIPFPAITICSERHIRKHQNTNCSIAMNNIMLATGLSDVPECNAFDYSDPNWWHDALISRHGNISMYLLFCVQEFLRCPVSHLRATISPMWDPCLTYHDQTKVKLYGFARNFLAVLDANTHNYTATTLAVLKGFSVYIHEPEVTPQIGDSPIMIAPGFHTSVTIQRQKRLRLPSPYESSCRNTTDGLPYSKIKCIQHCALVKLPTLCDCSIRLTVGATVDPTKKVCSMPEMALCNAKMYAALGIETHKCTLECPEECTTLRHRIVSVSVTKFEGKGYMKWAGDPTMGHSHLLTRNISDEYAEKNVASISIQYDDLSTEIIEQVPAYTWLALMADLGGALGLGMGACLMTFVQLFDVLFTCVSRIKGKRHGSIHPDSGSPSKHGCSTH